MRLLEVVRRRTHGAVDGWRDRHGFAKRVGRSASCPACASASSAIRTFAQYLREANLLLLEGATPRAGRRAPGRAFGFVSDRARCPTSRALDVGYKVRQENPHKPADPRYCRVEDALVGGRSLRTEEWSRLLPATRPARHQPENDPEVETLIRSEGAPPRRAGTRDAPTRRSCSAASTPWRTEGARILGRGHRAPRGRHRHRRMRHGYGFPPFRGGPMLYADEVGIARVRDAIARSFAAAPARIMVTGTSRRSSKRSRVTASAFNDA